MTRNPSNTARTALVIGGGIAGPVTAMALRKAGVTPRVFEAHTSAADGLGATLAIAPNGLDALRTIGADAPVRALGEPLAHTVVTDGRGRRIGAFSGLSDLPTSRGLWRSQLYRALHDRAAADGVDIAYGKRLVGVDEEPSGVTARFADGSTACADVLIGADGIRSTVRTLIDPQAPSPGHVPLLNFAGLADTSVAAAASTAYFVFGKRAFLGYWVQQDGRTAWFANVPHRAPMTSVQAHETPADEWLELLSRVYADDTPGRELVAHTRPDDLIALGSVEVMPSVPHWHRGRMVLVGDAVHAPSPSSGQGASLAAESAVQLARCLRDLPDPSEAFQAYERLRRPRVERVAARAAKTNRSKTLGPVAISAMRLMMPLATRTFLSPERALGPEHRHHISWDAPVSTDAAASRRPARNSAAT